MERWNFQAEGEIGSRDTVENKDSYLFPLNADAETEKPWERNPEHCLPVRTVYCVQGDSVFGLRTWNQINLPKIMPELAFVRLVTFLVAS